MTASALTTSSNAHHHMSACKPVGEHALVTADKDPKVGVSALLLRILLMMATGVTTTCNTPSMHGAEALKGLL